WIAGIFLLIPASSAVIWPLAALYVALQGVRYWVIATLGLYWTHHIITLDSAPIVKRGPYRWVRHPNYAVTIAETLLLPCVFGAWALGVIFTVVWIAVIRHKIELEDAALAERRSAVSARSPESRLAIVAAPASRFGTGNRVAEVWRLCRD